MSYFYWNDEAEQRRLAKIAAREHEEMTKMATVSMAREEAIQKLHKAKIPTDTNDEYPIIDMLKALGLLHIREETETLYQKHFDDTFGTVSLIKREDKVELWVGGKYRFSISIDDI